MATKPFMYVWIVKRDERDDFSRIVSVYDNEQDAQAHVDALNQMREHDNVFYSCECHGVLDELNPTPDK